MEATSPDFEEFEMDLIGIAVGVVGNNDPAASASEVIRVLRLLGVPEAEVARVTGLVCFGWESAEFAEV